MPTNVTTGEEMMKGWYDMQLLMQRSWTHAYDPTPMSNIISPAKMTSTGNRHLIVSQEGPFLVCGTDDTYAFFEVDRPVQDLAKTLCEWVAICLQDLESRFPQLLAAYRVQFSPLPYTNGDSSTKWCLFVRIPAEAWFDLLDSSRRFDIVKDFDVRFRAFLASTDNVYTSAHMVDVKEQCQYQAGCRHGLNCSKEHSKLGACRHDVKYEGGVERACGFAFKDPLLLVPFMTQMRTSRNRPVVVEAKLEQRLALAPSKPLSYAKAAKSHTAAVTPKAAGKDTISGRPPVHDDRYIITARPESHRDLMVVPNPAQQLHQSNKQLCVSGEFWIYLLSIAQALHAKDANGIWPNAIFFNFGAWETAQDQDPRLRECHGHAHIIPTLSMVNRLADEGNDAIRGRTREPDHYPSDVRMLIASRVSVERTDRLEAKVDALAEKFVEFGKKFEVFETKFGNFEKTFELFEKKFDQIFEWMKSARGDNQDHAAAGK